MYNEIPENINVDTLLKNTAMAENAALPFDEWKSGILNVATKTPEHETELLSIFEKSAARKRKLMSRIAYGTAACAAALLIMVTLSLNKRAFDENELYRGPAPAAQAPGTEAAEAPMAAAAAEEDAAGILTESEPEIDNLMLEEKSAVQDYGAVPAVPEDEAVNAVIEYIGAPAGESAENYTVELFAGEWFDVALSDNGEQALVLFEYAYVVTRGDGARYLVDANTLAVYPL